MTDTVLVRPRTGLILDGIPATGAAIPSALAEEWLADRLVERVEPAHLPSFSVIPPTPPQAIRPNRKTRRSTK